VKVEKYLLLEKVLKFKIMDNRPSEYKKGYVNFAGCKIDLSMGPLIPRKETEFWVMKIVNSLKIVNCKLKIDVLDIFAGSGCIGIAILKHIKSSRVIFAEIDKNLIRQIKLNLKLNKIDSKRYKVKQSDVFKGIQRVSEKFDYIFSNPPYIPTKNKYLVQQSVLDYEPHLALFGGEDGLLYIRKFLKDARKYLKPNGSIYMEFDWMKKHDLELLLNELNYKNYKMYKDHKGRKRWICIKN